MPGCFVVYYFGKWLKETIFWSSKKMHLVWTYHFFLVFGERRKEQRENAEKIYKQMQNGSSNFCMCKNNQ